MSLKLIPDGGIAKVAVSNSQQILMSGSFTMGGKICWISYRMPQKILTETYSRILWWNREARKLIFLICWYGGPCIWRSWLNCFLPKVKIIGFQK
jgi:hypothetical protein